MRARLIDPMGPPWTRFALPASAVAMTLASMLVHSAPLFCIAAALLFLAPLLGLKRPARDVTLALGSGFVDVRDAGVLAQRIGARDIKGASTARVDRGVGIALARSGRDGRPVILEVATEADATKLRDALGIGHHGFGTLAWPSAPSSVELFALWLRVICGATILLAAATSFFTRFEAFTEYLVTATLVGAIFVAFVFMNRIGAPAALRLTQGGLGAATPKGYEELPYAALADAALTKRGLRIDVASGRSIDVPLTGPQLLRTSMSEEERAHVVAQIRSATARAQGRGAPAPRVADRVSELGKRGEPARAWLARLDSIAELLSTNTGYRGVGFDEADLWATLGDHDAPADLRAGAARVLVRVAKEHAEDRVASLLDTVRDAPSREKIRVALDDDLERAVEELDALDPVTKRAV